MRGFITPTPDQTNVPVDNDRDPGANPTALLARIAEAIERQPVGKPNGPVVYESFAYALTEYQPIQLLGYDITRVRALVRASIDDVFIGKIEQLTGGLGFPLSRTDGDEITTNDAVYAAYLPETATGITARIGVFVEKVSNG